MHRRIGNNRCSACGCSKRTNPERLFHCFPNTLERCRLWIERCNIQGLDCKTAEQLRKYYKVCSDHFDKDSYSGKRLRLMHDKDPKRNLPEVKNIKVRRTMKRKLTPAKDHDDVEKTDANSGSETIQKFGGAVPHSDTTNAVGKGTGDSVMDLKLQNISCSGKLSNTVEKIVQNLADSKKKVRILRINNVPTENNNEISATAFEKIRSMLQKFSAEPNCKIEEVIKIVNGGTEGETTDEPPNTESVNKTSTQALTKVHPHNSISIMPKVSSSSETNCKNSGMTSVLKNKVTGVQCRKVLVPVYPEKCNTGSNGKNSWKTVVPVNKVTTEQSKKVAADPATHNTGTNCKICLKRLPSSVLTHAQLPRNTAQNQELNNASKLQKLSPISYTRRKVRPIIPQGRTPPIPLQNRSIVKVANINEITIPKTKTILDNIQNKNVLATPGMNAKLSFEEIASLEDFHSDTPTIRSVFTYTRPVYDKTLCSAPVVTAETMLEEVAKIEYSRDVPKIMNVFSYPQEHWTDTYRYQRPKAVKPPAVLQPFTCCRGRCPKCQADKKVHSAKVTQLRRSLKTAERKHKRWVNKNEELKEENKKLKELNEKLSQHDLDILNETQRRIVNGMLRSRQVNSHGFRYDPQLLNDSLTLRRISRAAYLFVKKKLHIPLPSEHGLRKYNNAMNRMVNDDGPVLDGPMPLEIDIHETEEVMAPVEVQAVEVISSNSGINGQVAYEVVSSDGQESYVLDMGQNYEMYGEPMGVQTVEVVSSDLLGEIVVIPGDDEL